MRVEWELKDRDVRVNTGGECKRMTRKEGGN